MKSWFAGHRAGVVLPALVLIAGVTLAIGGARWLQSRQQADAEADFDRMAQRSAADIAERFRQPLQGLLGLRSLYAVQPQVRRQDFRTYIETRNLPRDFPGVRGFGFIAQVPGAALNHFVASERADGEPTFTVHHFTAPPQADHFIIKLIEPAAANVGALGLDVGSEPVRRAGLQRALASGEPTLSGSITLVQDSHQRPGLMLFVPVFGPRLADAPATDDHGAPLGLLFAPVVIEELLSGLEDTMAGQAQIELFDNVAGGLAWAPIFQSHPSTDNDHLSRQLRRTGFETELPLALPGRQLMMRLRSTPSFDASHTSRTPVMFLIGTLLASALLSALLRLLANGSRLAEARAERMTVDLRRLALVARRTTNAVVITDVQRRITWVNEGFERLTGYTAAEALGQSPGALLQCADSDPATLRSVRRALDAGEGVSCELLNRGKCGRRYWLSVEIQPLIDDAGVLTGFMAIEQDITERRQAEAALQASQALLDKTGRIGGIGGWALDLAGQRVSWTDETSRIHDLPPGHQPTLDEALAFYPRDSRLAIEAAVQRVLETGVGFDIELPMLTASGRAIWVRAVGEVELLDGRPQRVVGAMQDITARRELGEQLRRSHTLLDTVLQSLPCGLSVFDSQLKLMLCNAEFSRLLDLPDRLCLVGVVDFEQLIRFNAARGEYGDADPEATVQAIVERARRPAESHLFERVRPNGLVLEVRAAPMAGGGFVTTYTDVSARARAEAEARRSGQVLRGAIDAIDEAFVLFDPEDRLLLCNDRYREIYAGVADQIVEGVPFADLVRAGAERGNYLGAAEDVEAWVVERMAAHRSADSTIVQKLANGRTLRIIERKLPDGHIVGFRIDITELVSATEAAQQASQAKSRFLANMSHEIRTPMNAVLGMLALLKRTPLTTRQADYADKTEGAARSLLGLLDDILDFSKVEAGRMTLDPQPFRLDLLLRDLSVILAAGLDDKPVALLFEIDAALPLRLVGDALRLRQVLINLGGNAIKFTAAGEVVLQFKLLAGDARRVMLRVAVRDTGIGIADEQQAQIFNSFTQAEASTTRRFGGTGLGLAISQRLVGLMGGELRVDSAPGQGSCFHFQIELPVAAAGTDDADVGIGYPGSPALAAPPSQRLAGLRLLVAEDNPNNQQVARELLVAEGAEVVIVADGQAAVQAVASALPVFDAVLMDLQMPLMDGFTATGRIRRDLDRSRLPIIAMTANVMSTDRDACLAAGMNEHVGKPFDLDHLVAVLQRLCGRATTVSPQPQGQALPAAVTDAAAAAGVAIASALARLGGKLPVYRRALASFADELDGLPARLRQDAAAVDPAALAQRLHTLKGLAATLGADTLAAAASAGERLLAAGPGSAACTRVCADLEVAISRACERLPALLLALQVADTNSAPRPATPASTAPDVGPSNDSLLELVGLLENSDMRATDLMCSLQFRHGQALGPTGAALADAVAALDFAAALRLCRPLLVRSVA